MQRQRQAVQAILNAVSRRPDVQAVFLKGSMGSGTADEHSDVDFYCLVDGDDREEFLSDRLQILSSYRPVVYWSEQNFVAPQIVAVYDDGLHVDLYAVTREDFPLPGRARVLHDPQEVLPELTSDAPDHGISVREAGRIFDRFTYTLLEFEAAWRRGDMAWADRLSRHLAGELGQLMRYRWEPECAQLGIKGLEKALPPEEKKQLRRALRSCSGPGLPGGVDDLCRLMKKTATHLQSSRSVSCNWDFWRLMRERIADL